MIGILWNDLIRFFYMGGGCFISKKIKILDGLVQDFLYYEE